MNDNDFQHGGDLDYLNHLPEPTHQASSPPAFETSRDFPASHEAKPPRSRGHEMDHGHRMHPERRHSMTGVVIVVVFLLGLMGMVLLAFLVIGLSLGAPAVAVHESSSIEKTSLPTLPTRPIETRSVPLHVAPSAVVEPPRLGASPQAATTEVPPTFNLAEDTASMASGPSAFPPVETTLSYFDFLTDYASDAKLAEEKYKGKRLRLEYITYRNQYDGVANVKLYIPRSRREKMTDEQYESITTDLEQWTIRCHMLRKVPPQIGYGELIHVEGTCQGLVGDSFLIRLDKCRFETVD